MKKPKKRGQGRPVTAEDAVGRQRLLTAARKLLERNAPARVTISGIAREADADPALVRYYFGDRTSLLMALVETMVSMPDPDAESMTADQQLAKHVHEVAVFSRAAKYMQRLMIDELAESKNPKVRNHVRQLHQRGVEHCQQLIEHQSDAWAKVNPLFLHLAIIGMFDFFATARPIIQLLLGAKTDLGRLGKEYEAFVTRLLLAGLQRKAGK